MKISINQAAKYEGQQVTIGCWLLQKRGSGKIQFLQLRDGTGFMQGIVVKENDADLFEKAKGLTQETSMYVSGTIKADDRSDFGYEMEVDGIEVIHASEGYPITPKAHGPEFLMDNRHLWLRSKKQHAVMNIRNQIIKSTHDFFFENGYKKIDPPILTSSSPEGTTELFHTKYFDEDAYLSQSGQLYAEAAAMAHGKVFSFGPTFRAEKSKTRRHLTEFWMVEPEMAYCNLDENMELAEQFVEYVVQWCLENCKEELDILERDTSKLENVKAPFPRITYDEAAKILADNGADFTYGSDFGGTDETIISEQFDRPVMVHRWPAEIKAFYMKRDADNDNLALGVDMLAPEGYGEIIGGGQREDDLAILEGRIKEHELDMKDFSWYLDLRKYGSVPHSGFGLGIERTVAWITGSKHIRETIPFPRTMARLEP